MTGADFTGADVKGADLTGVNTDGVRGLDRAVNVGKARGL
jgi:uncharacterized protein YjbI with pentapeptide repeats